MEDESCQSRSQGSSASGQPSPGPAAAPLPAAALAPGPVRRVAAMRKRHSKTRSGCRTCKRRKIKCDEGRPSCRNCIRHSTECDFAQINAGTHSLPTPSSLTGNEDADNDEEGALPINLMDLELMHNFTCATYSTLAADPLVRGVWKTSLVRRAGGCDYLMRAVLAVSAMHLAHQQQQNQPGGKAAEERSRYLSYGYRQHRVASKRAVAVMMGADKLGPEEAESLWLFSVLTMYFALGCPRSPSTSLFIGEDVLPDWIFLINGCRQLWAAMEDAPRTGIISPVLKHGGDHWRAVHRPEHLGSDVLDELSRYVDAGAKDRPEELRVYRDTMDKLRPQLSSVLARRARRGDGGGGDGEEAAADISDAFMWCFPVAEEFMPLLRARRQEAVAIYAHSCVILHALEHNRWVQGWADFVMGRAWEMLDEEHRMWIQWPMEEIGWAPPR